MRPSSAESSTPPKSRFKASLAAVALFLLACADGASPTSLSAPSLVPDSDGDGILGAADQCANQPETFNGWLDHDGCPDKTTEFYGLVRGDVEAFWEPVFRVRGWTYIPLAVFEGYEDTAESSCGTVAGRTFYCPQDLGVYYEIPFLDSFFTRVGDVAPAFIVSHEIGHHISFLIGYLKASQSVLFPNYAHTVVSDTEYELQADCFGGAWVAHADARHLLETGDVEEAVTDLVALSSYQRVTAFAAGFREGVSACFTS